MFRKPAKRGHNYPRMAPIFFRLITVLMFLSLGSFQHACADEKDLPFSAGERLTLRVKWGFITAGEGVLEVLPPKKINGVKSHHYRLTVKTSPLIDVFYKVRDRIDSFVNMDMSRSLLYKKKKSGDTRKDIRVKFNWNRNKAQYSNFGKKRAPIDIPPATLDPLAVFYAFRSTDLSTEKEIERFVSDGKKCVMGKLDIVKKEKISVGGKKYDAVLVEPRLEHLEGVFERSKKATLKIWVTADKYHIPLKIKSSVIVGNFVGELVSATGLKGKVWKSERVKE